MVREMAQSPLSLRERVRVREMAQSPLSPRERVRVREMAKVPSPSGRGLG